MSDDEGVLVCDACGGVLYWLGWLGQRGHLRCRDCGMDSSVPVPEDDDDDQQAED